MVHSFRTNDSFWNNVMSISIVLTSKTAIGAKSVYHIKYTVKIYRQKWSNVPKLRFFLCAISQNHKNLLKVTLSFTHLM